MFVGLYGLTPGMLSAIAIVRPKPSFVGTAQVFVGIGDGSRGPMAAVRKSLWTSDTRPVETVGHILPMPILGGLHHQYVRI